MYGKEIKKIRTTLKLTQNQVSEAAGISQSTISWIESDEGVPNIQQCIKLADFYGVSLDELVGRDFKK